MIKLKCPKCGKVRYSSVTGWICEECGGELEEVEMEESDEPKS